MEQHNCRVCGLFIDNLPWGESGDCPTYEICPCCGVEFGNEDYLMESAKKYRKEWISGGANWFAPKGKPEHWQLSEQIMKVSDMFK
jgi:hypothetical protein